MATRRTRRCSAGCGQRAIQRNSGPAQKKAAIGGLGICLLPIGSLQPHFVSDELLQVLPGVASSVGNLYVVYPSGR